jgi:transposase
MDVVRPAPLVSASLPGPSDSPGAQDRRTHVSPGWPSTCSSASSTVSASKWRFCQPAVHTFVRLSHRELAPVSTRALDRTMWLDRIARRLAALAQTARVRVARDALRRIRELTRAERELERELRVLIQIQRPDLLAEDGVGTITAAVLIGRTAGAQRFPTDGHYARRAGAAPIPASSGRRDRVRLNRGGDRQLNRALHRIAVTRARTCPQTRAYLDRKLGEGKTKAEAYRCLKRHLARRIWRLLRDGATIPTTSTSTPTTSVNAPIPVACLT